MCAAADRARRLASASQPSGKPYSTDVRGTLTSIGRLAGFESDASTRERRSPFRAVLIVCVKGATPDRAGAADTLMLMSAELITTIRLQAIKRYRTLQSLDETNPDICGAMIRSPIPSDEEC